MAMTTASGAQLRKRYRLITRVVIGASVLCLALSVWFAREWAGNRARHQLVGTARESLALQIEALTGVMEKYRLIPPLLSRRADIGAALSGSGGREVSDLQHLLMGVAAASGARDILIADIEGHVLTSARGLADTATIQASRLPVSVSQRRLGRAALTLADGSHAYAFASHVAGAGAAAGTNIGMIVVLVPFGTIEANWSLSSHAIFVTDASDFVFLSNIPGWVGKPWNASEAAPGLEPLAFASGDLVRIPSRDNGEFVEASRTLPNLGWTMHVLVGSRPVADAQRNAALFAGLAVALAGLSALFVVIRRNTSLMLMRREKAQSMRLERLVRDRTAELSDVNEALRNEIEVRRQTEKQLRETQDELVHAAKLAVIGQMSATLSHEYNQPLAAIKTYAGNAQTMIARGKTAGLPDVLSRISQMVDRMSALSKTLLAFSRKPGTTLHPVPIEAVVGEALLLVGQKAKNAGVAVTTDIEPDLTAHTGRIRLSQVVVNLVGNAIDALCDGHDKAPRGASIVIAAHARGPRVLIEISDNGPGISAEMRERIFEPFFTTKPVGSGLGLGLSIVDSITRDLRGSVRVEEREGQRGACFVVDLPAFDQQAEAAE